MATSLSGYRLQSPEGIPVDHVSYFSGGINSITYKDCLKKVLVDIPPSNCGVKKKAGEGVLKQTDLDLNRINESKFSRMNWSSLRIGDEMTHSIAVEGGTPIFVLRFTNGNATFKLIDPSGKIIDYSNANTGIYGQVEFEKNANAIIYRVSNATSGIWKMVVKRQETSIDDVETSAYALFNTPLILSANTDQNTYRLGESIKLTAKLTGAAIKSVEVNAKIISVDGKTDIIPMIYDGTQYIGEYSISPATGFGFIEFQAIGMLQDGKVFERGGMLDFYVPGSTNYLPVLTNMLDNGPPIEIP